MSISRNTIPCPLNAAARKHGSSPAVIWGTRRITYQQLDQYVNATVKAFKERGIKAASRVALVAENSVEAVIILFSLWRLGAVACPIDPRFPNQTVIALLKKVRAQAVIVGDPKGLSGAKIDITKIFITDLIVFDVKDSFYKDAGEMSLTVDLEQEAAVVFTSGISADAKAAVLTYGNLYFNALGSNERIPLQKDDRWLLSLPLFHVSGLGILFRVLLAGAAVVIVQQKDTGRILSEGKATHISMVATQLFRLVNDGQLSNISKIKAILLGGSAIPQNLIEQALRLKLPVYVSYGLTEMASQVATGRVVSVGKNCAAVLSHCDLKISFDGEIGVRGPTLFKGYLTLSHPRPRSLSFPRKREPTWSGINSSGDPRDEKIDSDESKWMPACAGMTKQQNIVLPVDEDGWFHTGDLGALDKDGCLRVIGRKDNMFISGGENIHPEEIEASLLKINNIVQAVVVPQPDQEFGERPVAFIQWKDTALKPSEIQKFLKAKLPKFKVPVAFLPWPLNTSEGGLKVNRRYFRGLVRRGGKEPTTRDEGRWTTDET